MTTATLHPLQQAAYPFDPAHYRSAIPEIERRIEVFRPHVIVFGHGPSAWMMREVRPELFQNVRLWGVNDGFKILPTHDLTIMDYDIRELHPNSPRHKTVIESRPDRWWVYDRAVKCWRHKLKGPIREFQLNVWKPGKNKVPLLQSNPHNHTISSPVGTVSIAWQEGCRRIAVVGVDLLDGQHRLSHYHEWIDRFLGHFRKQARELGGDIVTLSPFARTPSLQPTNLPMLVSPCLSASSLAPTCGSTQPEPSACSSTQSGNTPAATSTSSGCARGRQTIPIQFLDSP